MVSLFHNELYRKDFIEKIDGTAKILQAILKNDKMLARTLIYESRKKGVSLFPVKIDLIEEQSSWPRFQQEAVNNNLTGFDDT